jgi:hypothetical protein
MFVNFVDISKTSPMPISLRQVSSINTFYEYFGLNEFSLSKGLHNTKYWILQRIRKYGTINFNNLINNTTNELEKTKENDEIRVEEK